MQQFQPGDGIALKAQENKLGIALLGPLECLPTSTASAMPQINSCKVAHLGGSFKRL